MANCVAQPHGPLRFHAAASLAGHISFSHQRQLRASALWGRYCHGSRIGGDGGRHGRVRRGRFSASRSRSRSSSSSSSSRSSSNCGARTNCRLQPCIFYYNDVYRVDLPAGHRFPMQKYEATRELLQRDLSGGDSAAPLAHFEVSPLATFDELITTHDADYVRRYMQGQFTAKENRVVGFPWSKASVERSISSVGGTVAAARAALDCSGPRITGHIAGGTHHAFAAHGEGFCVFSDIAVAANVVLRENHCLQRILIVDLDVHQGNGNAVLFQEEDRVFTFSVQCRDNLFSQEQHSDLDVYLSSGDGDEVYLRALQSHLEPLFVQLDPQLVFFQAGVDILNSDRLGKLTVTREGLRARNDFVFDLVLNSSSKARLVLTLGGGYPRNLDPQSNSFLDIVEAHADVYRGAAQALARYQNQQS